MLSQLKVAILEKFGPGRQYEAARRAGLSESTLSRIVVGRRKASAKERRAIANVLEARPEDLFPGDDPTEPRPR